MGEEVAEIISKIKERGLFQSITRLKYLPYKMEMSLQMIEAIGKERRKHFQIDDENRFVYENLIRWVHGDEEMKCLHPATQKIIPGRLDAGIYIGGQTGTGKSWALEIMAAYCLVDNVQIKIGENMRCLYWQNERTGVICDEYTSAGSFEKFKKMAIIGIQDLGAEPAESLYMGNRVPVMSQILEHRGDQTNLITLITSNLPMNSETLSDRYGDRVLSRLSEMCNYFEIRGKDRRKQ